MKTLLVLNDAPYGSERTNNGARLAGTLARQEGREVRVFLIGDGASAAHNFPQPADMARSVEANLRGVVPEAASSECRP